MIEYMNQISAKETENVMKIDVSHITMIYPSGKKALQDISLSAESPNFIGVLGPNGAGKTTIRRQTASLTGKISEITAWLSAAELRTVR